MLLLMQLKILFSMLKILHHKIKEVNFATEARELLLCPYRALKMYIKRTESQRKEIDSDSLFITYQKGVCRPHLLKLPLGCLQYS
jgi:hypothetical protein